MFEIGDIVLFVFAAIGFTHIVVDGSILSGFRRLMERILPASIYEVFKCYQCSGFWCGLFCGYFTLIHGLDMVWWLQIIMTIMCGFASSFFSYGAAILLNVLESTWFNAEAKKEVNER